MSFHHLQIIAFKWFFLIKVKTHLSFLFNRWVFLGFSCISVNPCDPRPDPFSRFSHEQVKILVETRVAHIKSPSFLYPAGNLLEQMLMYQIPPLVQKCRFTHKLLGWCFPSKKPLKNASTTSVATDFLQLFAQEMSALSDVMTLSGFWSARDLNSPFCN